MAIVRLFVNIILLIWTPVVVLVVFLWTIFLGLGRLSGSRFGLALIEAYQTLCLWLHEEVRAAKKLKAMRDRIEEQEDD